MRIFKRKLYDKLLDWNPLLACVSHAVLVKLKTKANLLTVSANRYHCSA